MARVIQDQGPEAIEKRIGVDATGMRFNSIVAVEMANKLLAWPPAGASSLPYTVGGNGPVFTSTLQVNF